MPTINLPFIYILTSTRSKTSFFEGFEGFLKVFKGYGATKSSSKGCWSGFLTVTIHSIDINNLLQGKKHIFSKVFEGI